MKKALIASLTLNVLIAIFFVGKRYYYAHSQPPAITKTVSPFDLWNNMRTSLFAFQTIDSNDVVFIGNSLTEAFPVTELFGTRCKNRGIGGNKTTHILNRIANIAIDKPQKIFIEAGINDFVFGGNVDTAFSNYASILKTIRQLSPRTIIYVQSTIPTCGPYTPYNEPVKELNKKLFDYCNKTGINYIDVHAEMLSAGKMDSTLTEDGLHLNGKGYRIWQRTIERYVK